MSARRVKIQGGLGNQLFCLAFAHAMALRGGLPVELGVSIARHDAYGNRFELADLANRLGGFPQHADAFSQGRIGGRLAQLSPFIRTMREPVAVPADIAAFTAPDGLYVGYWQDERWFADASDYVPAARDFILDRGDAEVHPLVIHYRSYRDETRPERRGTPERAFFQAAYDQVVARVGRPARVVLVSDDPALALVRIDGAIPAITVQSAGKYGDMATLMRAQNLIVSNSSFSWWGAYLSEAANVFYPRRDGLFHYAAPAYRFTVI